MVLVIKALEEYCVNFVTVLVFLLLGLFVFVFSLFANTFVSSGTVFLEYNILTASPLQAFVQLVLAIVYLAFFSLFMVVLIFAVRQHTAQVKFDTYLREKIPRFALELFEFLLVFSIIAFVAGLVLVSLGVPTVLVAFLLLVFSGLLFFVPQSIVIDEVSWVAGIDQALHFLFSNIGLAFFVLAVGVVLIALLPFIELFFDQFAFVGRFVSLFILLIAILPFIEILKSVAYLNKFELVRGLP